MVAYDQSVRENAISKPAHAAGIIVKREFRLALVRTPDRDTLSFRAPFLGRPFKFAMSDGIVANSAATSVSIAEASAAKKAEAKFTRMATLPKGISDAMWASTRYKGNPGGCATPSE